MPPLELTGERTLPDVPGGELLVPAPPGRLRVDRARGCAGLRVADLACGEGYGSDVLAGARGRGGRRRRQPRGPRARPAALPAPEPALRARPGRGRSRSPCDAIVFLQTIEHIHEPGALLERLRARRRRCAYVSTPEPAHARAAGRREVRQPLAPARVHAGRVPGAARAALLAGRAARRSSTPASCALHELALRARLGPRPPRAADHEALLRPLRARDRRRRLRAAPRTTRPRPGARLPRRLPLPDRRDAGGDLAIVLHSPHALRRGLRDLSVRRGVAVRRGGPLLPARARRGARPVTVTVTPGARRPARGARAWRSGCAAFLRAYRLERGRARRGATCRADLRAACRAEAERYRARARRGSRRSAATLLAAFADAAASGRVELVALGRDPRGAAAARHRRGPAAADRRRAALAPAPVRRAARVLASRVRLRPGLERAARRARPALLLHRPERARASRSAALAPVAAAGRPGRASRSTGRRSSWLWSLRRLSVRSRATPTSTASRCAGTRPWSIGGGPVRPRAAAAERAREQAARVRRRGRRAARALSRPSAARPGLVVFAIDTELLGHWWWEGPAWLERGPAPTPASTGCALRDPRRGARAPRAGGAARCGDRPGARARTCAPGTRPRSPTSPGPRGGSSCACCAALGAGLDAGRGRARRARAARGAGERLGVPRPPPAGGRLPVPARHGPRAGAARGHTLRREPRRPAACETWRPTSASRPLLEP